MSERDKQMEADWEHTGSGFNGPLTTRSEIAAKRMWKLRDEALTAVIAEREIHWLKIHTEQAKRIAELEAELNGHSTTLGELATDIRETGAQIAHLESEIKLHPDERGLLVNLGAFEKRFKRLEERFADLAKYRVGGCL